jgi:hypothetical protein
VSLASVVPPSGVFHRASNVEIKVFGQAIQEVGIDSCVYGWKALVVEVPYVNLLPRMDMLPNVSGRFQMYHPFSGFHCLPC